MHTAAISLLLVAAVAVLTPAQVGGLIPPRYDLPQGRWWEKTAVRPGSTRHQTTSYRVYNSAGPLPPYSFAVNSAAPKPSCQPRTSCVGHRSSAGRHPGSSGAGPKPPAEYIASENSAGPRPPPAFQVNSAGPKPTPSYQTTVSSAGLQTSPDSRAAHNSVGPKMPPFASNSVGPKLPPGYTFASNSAGPRLPTGARSSSRGVGPKPPQGYSFTAGPKMNNELVLPASPAPSPAARPLVSIAGPETVLVQTRVQTHVPGPGQQHSRAQAHARAQAGDRKTGAWSTLENETQPYSGRKSR